MIYAINELDVWRDYEGFYINNVFRDVARIEINNPYSVREVLRKVREKGYVLKHGKYNTNIKELCSSDMFEIVNRKTGKYILQLERVDNE